MASAWDNLGGDFASRLRGLIAESGGKVTMVSGYRSPQRQQQLWANALAKYGTPEAARKWVAPPGHSNHERGVAVDLGGDLQLAHTLAPKYGLSFPMGHEPWHIEVAGTKGSAQAYTDPPDDEMQDAGGDHIDKMMTGFQQLFSGEAGEADVSAVGEGATPSPSDGAPMSGATQTQGEGVDGARQLGQQLATRLGWNQGPEWEAFNELVMRESGWNPNAANPKSTARGIAQNINGYSADYQEGNAEQQINWMLNYVKNRYGSPTKAIEFHNKNNWY